MKKLNEIVYRRLLLQAEEAKEIGLYKLASGVLNSIGPVPEDENLSYSYGELQKDIYEGMWKLAANVMKYRDINSVDIQKVDEVLETFTNNLIASVEETLGTDMIGPLDPKVPGESE